MALVLFDLVDADQLTIIKKFYADFSYNNKKQQQNIFSEEIDTLMIK